MDIKYFAWQEQHNQRIKERQQKFEKIKEIMDLFECSYEDALAYYNFNYEKTRGNL